MSVPSLPVPMQGEPAWSWKSPLAASTNSGSWSMTLGGKAGPPHLGRGGGGVDAGAAVGRAVAHRVALQEQRGGVGAGHRWKSVVNGNPIQYRIAPLALVEPHRR